MTDKNAIQEVLNVYDEMGTTAQDALGTKNLTLKEIEKHYESFKSTESSEDNQGTASDTPLFLRILDQPAISKAVISHSGIIEVLTLRKVCTHARSIVNDKTAHIKLLKIYRFVNDEFIEVDGDRVRYERNRDQSLSLRRNGILKTVKIEGSIVDLAAKALGEVLDIPKLKISELEIKLDGISEKVLKHVVGLREPLSVRQVTTNSLNAILPYLKPKDLEVIQITRDSPFNRHIGAHDYLLLMPQWKQAKILITNMIFCCYDIPQYFGHFDYADVPLEDNSGLGNPEHLVILKDIFLTRPKFQKLEIIPLLNHNPYDPLFLTVPPEFEPFEDRYTDDWYHFPYPNSDQMLSVHICRERILFKGPAFEGDKIVIEGRRVKVDRMAENVHNADDDDDDDEDPFEELLSDEEQSDDEDDEQVDA